MGEVEAWKVEERSRRKDISPISEGATRSSGKATRDHVLRIVTGK